MFDFGLHLIVPYPYVALFFRCGCVLAPDRVDRCALHDESPLHYPPTRAA